MIKKVSDIADSLRNLLGDGTADIPTEFIINILNWALNDLPTVPKLDKLFSKHKQFNLDAKNHYRWNLNDRFRRILSIPMLNFYTSDGGEPCKLSLCHRAVKDFYDRNGIIELKQPGKPCEYTIETEGDEVWLVLDRPSDVPIIVDYIAYGVLKPVSSLDDEIELSALAENLILDIMQRRYLMESDDYAQAGAIIDYIDNKKLPEIQQQLYRRWKSEAPRILGEA